MLGQAGNYFAPGRDNAAYLFNENGIVQLGDIVYRGLNSTGKFLAMPVENLSPVTYQKLVDGTFDPAVMCNLAVGSNTPGGAAMSNYVRTHIGLDDNSNPPTPPIVCGRVVVWHYIQYYTDGSFDEFELRDTVFFGRLWSRRTTLTYSSGRN